MRTFEEECAELALLQTFDPTAFQADAKIPQDLCNFILTLALVHNDFKNLIYAYIITEQSRPKGKFVKNRLWGAFVGVQFHVLRAIISLLHELFKLITKNEHLLKHPFFTSVLKQINPSARKAWETVVSVALGTTPSDPLGKNLLLVRNKMSFHYDGKAIFTGYSHHFLNIQHLEERPYISRGNSMKESRFYFADAAAIGYLRSIVGRDNIDDQLEQITALTDPVNGALMAIVESYIQRRGPYQDAIEGVG